MSFKCNHCGGTFERDDMEIIAANNAGCCLHCWLRITETEKPMSDQLRREIRSVMPEMK